MKPSVAQKLRLRHTCRRVGIDQKIHTADPGVEQRRQPRDAGRIGDLNRDAAQFGRERSAFGSGFRSPSDQRTADSDAAERYLDGAGSSTYCNQILVCHTPLMKLHFETDAPPR